MFAKLYGTDKDQVLVKMDANEEGRPELRFYCEPDGLGVCSLAISFGDNENGWSKAERGLKDMTEEKARTMVKRVMDQADNVR
jgi:hypothetical protein